MSRAFYSAVQAAKKLRVKPHVLRYWETKFGIKPERNSAGRRIYSQEQIDKFGRIKFLRYDEKMTIKGARNRLSMLSRASQGKRLKGEDKALLLWLRKELTDLRDMLSS